MNEKQYLENLTAPEGKVDFILDTDAFNEIDDLYAVSYILKSPETPRRFSTIIRLRRKTEWRRATKK